MPNWWNGLSWLLSASRRAKEADLLCRQRPPGSEGEERARSDYCADADVRVQRRRPQKPIGDGEDRPGVEIDADQSLVVGGGDTQVDGAGLGSAGSSLAGTQPGKRGHGLPCGRGAPGG